MTIIFLYNTHYVPLILISVFCTVAHCVSTPVTHNVLFFSTDLFPSRDPGACSQLFHVAFLYFGEKQVWVEARNDSVLSIHISVPEPSSQLPHVWQLSHDRRHRADVLTHPAVWNIRIPEYTESYFRQIVCIHYAWLQATVASDSRTFYVHVSITLNIKLMTNGRDGMITHRWLKAFSSIFGPWFRRKRRRTPVF